MKPSWLVFALGLVLSCSVHALPCDDSGESRCGLAPSEKLAAVNAFAQSPSYGNLLELLPKILPELILKLKASDDSQLNFKIVQIYAKRTPKEIRLSLEDPTKREFSISAGQTFNKTEVEFVVPETPKGEIELDASWENGVLTLDLKRDSVAMEYDNVTKYQQLVLTFKEDGRVSEVSISNNKFGLPLFWKTQTATVPEDLHGRSPFQGDIYSWPVEF